MRGRLSYLVTILLSLFCASAFWILDALLTVSFFTDNARFMMFTPPTDLGEALLSNVSAQHLVIRILFVILSLSLGIVTGLLIRNHQHREQQISRYMEDSPTGILVVDRYGRIAEMNSETLRILNRERGELLGEDAEILARSVPIPAELWIEIENLSADESLSFESRILHVDDTALDIWFQLKKQSDRSLFIYTEDITARKEAEKTRETYFDRLKNLASHIERVKEEQNSRIARDIHDNIGQKLTAVELNLASLIAGCTHSGEDDDPLINDLEQSRAILRQTINTAQDLFNELHPSVLEILGLFGGLEWLVSEYRKKSSLIINLSRNGFDLEPEAGISKAVFRFVQEALTNIVRHSHDRTARVSLDISKTEIRVDVIDNGVGFDTDAPVGEGCFGLSRMNDWASSCRGRIELDSHLNAGTTVSMVLPGPGGGKNE